MKKPLKLFVEGMLEKKGKVAHSTDSAFLRDCIYHWFNKPLNVLTDFQYIGGASELKNMATDIRRAEEQHQVLVIIDANGNPEARRKEVEDFKAKENLGSQFFLFPDNKNTGEVEVLIEQIATDRAKLDCYEAYEKCIGRELDIKDKVFAYFVAVTGNKEAAKDKNRNFNNEHFNLNDERLKALREFLSGFVEG